jgi:hypothetical protein
MAQQDIVHAMGAHEDDRIESPPDCGRRARKQGIGGIQEITVISP